MKDNHIRSMCGRQGCDDDCLKIDVSQTPWVFSRDPDQEYQKLLEIWKKEFYVVEEESN